MSKVYIVFGMTDRWQTILDVFSSYEAAQAFSESISEKNDDDYNTTYYPYNGIFYEAILIDERTVR